MKLTLVIAGVDRLDNGGSPRLSLDRHGAVIGRSPHADWCLPDPANHISSTHCEIDYRDGAYTLVDRSTNGTYINGSATRPAGPHRIADGDRIVIGHYEISAQLGEAAPAAPPAGPGAAASAEWGGWDSHAAPVPAAPSAAGWDRPPAQPAISGRGPMSQNWAAPRVETPPRASSVWDSPAIPGQAPSGWSSPVTDASSNAAAVDVWGRLAESNEVDWGRGGFGAAPAPAPKADPFGLDRRESPAAPRPAAPAPARGWDPAPAATPGTGGEYGAFLRSAGVAPSDLRGAPAQVLTTAGAALARVVAGLIVMLEARTRAKAQLGAQGTSLEFDGNNPLKFARSPEAALAQLLNPAERGFMGTEQAIEDAFKDLQAHQMATLVAMRGALAATLARFSPASIRERAETRGVMAKILPSARDAAYWQAYEKEFEGVAKGSDEAFMDIFAKEFRQAYEQAAADMKRKR